MRSELVELGHGAHVLAIQILGNVDDAADAVHDSFARVLARPEAYDPGKGPLKPWFLRIVRNRCVDLLRKRRDTRSPVEELVDGGRLPEQEFERREQDRLLQAALQELTVEQRQIVILRDYLNLSYKEIANVLEIAPGTVMSRLHRSRLALKEVLEGHDPD